MLLFSKWVKGNSFFFVFQTLLKTLMKHFLCITLTMHAKILLADSNIAPSITKRAKLFVLFCVVPLVFTVGLHTLRFFSGQKRPTTNWNFLFSPINHHGKKNCFTQQFSWDWFIYISLDFHGGDINRFNLLTYFWLRYFFSYLKMYHFWGSLPM